MVALNRYKEEGRFRQALFDHEIYPPVHWPIKGIVPEKFRDSHQLSDEIMTSRVTKDTTGGTWSEWFNLSQRFCNGNWIHAL